MSNAQLRITALALSLTVVTASRGEDRKDALDDPLPKGAKARLGSTRGGPPSNGGRCFPLPPDYTTFAMPDFKKGPLIHDMRSGRTTELAGIVRPQIPTPRPEGAVVYAVSADGTRIVTSRDRVLVVREIASGKELAAIETAKMGSARFIGPNQVTLSRDGSILACLFRQVTPGKGERQELVVFDLAANKEVARIETASSHPALSPDGKRIAAHTGGPRPDGLMRIWDVRTGNPVATLSDSFSLPGIAARIEFSPDGKLLASSDGQGVIRLWDAETGESRDPLLAPPGHGVAIAFSPGTKTLASLSRDWSVERWTLADGKSLPPTPFPQLGSPPPERYQLQDLGIRFVSEDRIVVWGTLLTRTPTGVPLPGRLVAWEPLSGKFITPMVGHSAEIQVVQFTADGREIVTLGADQRLVRWDAATGAPLGVIPIKTSDGAGYLTNVGPGAERGLRNGVVYDLKAGADDFVLPAAIIHPSADFSLAACFRPSRDRKDLPATGHIWDLSSRKRFSSFELPPTAQMTGPREGIAAAFTPNRDRLLTAVRYHDTVGGGAPILVNAWDVKTGKKLSELIDRSEGGSPERAAAAADGSGVVVTTSGEMWAVDFERGVKGHIIDRSPIQGKQLTCPVFSPDGKRMAVGSPLEEGLFGVRIFEWPRGTLLHTFSGHTGQVNTLAFSPDGKMLASGSADTTVLLWDLFTIGK